MAKLTWGFDILPGSATIDVDIRTAYSDGFLTCPNKFPVNFTPRSEKHSEVIMSEFESVKAVFANYEWT